MGRRKKGNKINGWINLDKPAGLTSTQAMAKVRKALNAQKAGHAGTLDPIATGILPIALGEATKTIPYVQDSLKSYEFTIAWGEQRDTDDVEGEVVATSEKRPSEQEIIDALPGFIGEIEQIPPKFSAIKIDGERAYDLAREGEEFEIKARTVFVESLELLETTKDTATLRMRCGKGTYVRSLARDLAEKLATYGYVRALRRTEVGCFTAEDAISLDFLENMSDSAAAAEAVLPLESALDDILAFPLKDGEAAKLKNGQVLTLISKPDFSRLENLGDTSQAIAMYDGKPIAIVEVEGPKVKPVRVFNL